MTTKQAADNMTEIGNLVDAARKAFARGDLAQARQLFEDAHWRADDTPAEIPPGLAMIALRQGNVEAAAYWGAEALACASTADRAVQEMAELALACLPGSESESWFERMLCKRPASRALRTGLQQARQADQVIKTVPAPQSKTGAEKGRFDAAVWPVAPLQDPDWTTIPQQPTASRVPSAEIRAVVRNAKRLRRRRDFEGAGRLLATAIAHHGGESSLLIELGFVANGQKRFENAKQLFFAAHRQEPENVVVLNMLGALEMKAREADDQALNRAEGYFALTLQYDPKNTRALVNMGWVQLRRGRTHSAPQYFERTLAEEPGNPRALEGLGEVAMRNGDYAQAKKWWEKAWWDHGSERPFVLTNLAKVAMAEGDFQAARSLLTQAVKLVPDDAYAMTSLGYLSILQERFGEAESWLTRAERQRPNDARITNLRGKLAQKRGDFRLARQWFSLTLERHPENSYAMLGLGWTAYELGSGEEAIYCFEHVLARQPGNAHARTGLGVARARLGEYEVAEQCYRQTLENRFHPPALWHWFRVAAIMGSLQQLAWFVGAAAQAIGLDPWITRELEMWQTRITMLLALVKDGRDPWDFIRQVGTELPHFYHAADVSIPA